MAQTSTPTAAPDGESAASLGASSALPNAPTTGINKGNAAASESSRAKNKDDAPNWLPFLAIPAVVVLVLVIGSVLYVMRKRARSLPAPEFGGEPDDAPKPRWGTELSLGGEYAAPPRSVVQSANGGVYEAVDSVLD